MQKKKKEQPANYKNSANESFDASNIRFIVSMPGKSTRLPSSQQLVYKKMHTFSDIAGDIKLEDFQAQFLMQRDYLID